MKNNNNGGALTIAMPSVKLESDPHKMEDIQSMFLAQQLYRSLFKFRSDGTIEPELASQVLFSADRKQIRVRIKGGQVFSDGSPITGEHVVASLKRPFVIGSSIAADLSYIEGGRLALKTQNPDKVSIRLLPSGEIDIQLSEPSELLATHLALPDLAILKITDPAVKEIPEVYSGSFKISNRNDDEIGLVRWAQGQGDDLKTVVLKRTDPAKAFEMAKAGLLDSVEQFSFSEKENEELKALGWKASVHSLSYENFLLMNPKYLSPDFRRLIQAALPTEMFSSAFGLAPAHGLIPANLPGALQQMVIAEPPPTRLRSEEKLELHFNRGNALHVRAAELIQRNFSALNVKVILKPLEHDDFYDHLLKKKSAAIIAGKGIDYPDGLANLAYFRTDVPGNFLFLESSLLDRRIAKLGMLPTEKRIAEYLEIQMLILKQATVVPLFFGHVTSGLWSARATFVPSHPYGFQFLKLDEVKL